MNKKIKILLLIACSFQLEAPLQAQDLHFSQFFNSPLTTNPANTGFIPDADYRIGANYRNQWSTVMSVPYKTISVFGDAQVFRDRLENGWLGLGALILSDQAGTGSLTSTKIYGSSLLSAGFNIGWANKRINQSKLKFPDQFDGKFFDSKVPTIVTLSTNNVSYLDIHAGINYAYFPDENVYINAGYSLQHANRPRETFFNDNTTKGRIPIQKSHDRVIVNPNAYFSTQAKATELVFGINANYNLSQFGEQQLLAGVYYRLGDAIVPMVGFEVKNIQFAFSYDVTLSGLSKFNGYRGASEFSIIKKGFYPENADRQSLCPKF
jgi:type IX secretion system PorP/SprF family membrane protein